MKCIILLFTLIVPFTLYPQRTNSKAEKLVKQFVVNYADGTGGKNNYRVIFDYNDDGSIKRMEHYFNDDGYDRLHLYRVYNGVLTFSAHYRVNGKYQPDSQYSVEYVMDKPTGYIAKKTVKAIKYGYENTYRFLYENDRVSKMILLKKSRELSHCYEGETNYTWTRGNLEFFKTVGRYGDAPEEKIGQNSSYEYWDTPNRSNIDFNWLFINGDIRNSMEGLLGLMGGKMNSMLHYEVQAYGRENAHYKYRFKDGNMEYINYYFDESKGQLLFMIIKIEYESK